MFASNQHSTIGLRSVSVVSATITCVVVWICCFHVSYADDPAVHQHRFFETKVRPLLVQHCLKCHSKQERKGVLRLDSRVGWQTGGDSGPAIVPSKPDESLLIRAVRYDDGVSGMPPTGKLPELAIRVLEQWVAAGASDPRQADAVPPSTADRRAIRDHWSFQPLGDPAVPPRRNSWPQSPIDHFVAERQHALGLQPVGDADRHTWLRRVTLDLTGLPPTVAEIRTFLRDVAPGAHERVVDRLLDSTAFGETWARHWLDLGCYADTIGSSSMPMRHAWRYRDYVIAALNQDTLLDEFVRQQIAGDLLPADSPE